MSVKEHYENHLANFYSWMLGDFESGKNNFKNFCIENNIKPENNSVAIDLGAGNGIQSVALAELGYKVTAIDFSDKLLDELKQHTGNLSINIVNDDILNFKNKAGSVELIVCCGDTLAHIESFEQVEKLFSDVFDTLEKGGEFLISFRDYEFELKDTDRFIPVKSDTNRILTCCLEYTSNKVQVTDLLYENIKGKWEQKVSDYTKLRLTTDYIFKLAAKCNFSIAVNENINRMIHVVLSK